MRVFIPTARSKNEQYAIVILHADRQRFAGSARLALCFRMALIPGPIDYIMLLMYASLSQDSAGITTYPQLVCMRDNFACVPIGNDFRNGRFATT